MRRNDRRHHRRPVVPRRAGLQRVDRGPALVRVQDPRGVEHRGRWTPWRCAPTRRCSSCALVEARFPTGTHETYQVPLGLRPADEGWNERVIFENDDWTVYDALADPAAGRELLHAMRSNAESSRQDEFIFRWAERGAGLGGTVDVRPVGVEQSNSSIVFGDELILKAFRKVEPGVNPELELLRFLSARGFPHIAPLAGWYEVEGRHISATLGILQEFLAGARDGWDLALDELDERPERPARPHRGARRRDRRAAHGARARTTPTRRSRPTSRRPRRSRSSPPTSTSRSSASSSTCPRRRRSRRSAAAARTCARSSTRSRTSPPAGA